MWENVVMIRVVAKSECRKSDVLLEILSKEQYESLLIPKWEINFSVILNKRNDKWVLSNVYLHSFSLAKNYISVATKYTDEIRGMNVSDKNMKKMVMKGRFDVVLFGKNNEEYNRAKITWEYYKNVKKKMKKSERKMVDLMSEMV